MAHFDVPLNLPHASTIAHRLLDLVSRLEQSRKVRYPESYTIARELVTLLAPIGFEGENPAGDEAWRVRDEAAALGRRFVEAVERERIGFDRLGQCVRNLFECLELGREGADISLRAGEDPKSLQRPV